MPDARRALWIAWEHQVRNRSLSGRLGVELHVFASRRARLVRYVLCSCRSLRLLWNRRPSIVFAPNPSLVLSCLLLILRAVFKYTLVIDAHYAGVVAPGRNTVLQKVLDHINRSSDLVIVTNEAHRRCVNALGGRALVCEDPLPDIGAYAATSGAAQKAVFFICSFDVDEPYADVFRAASLLQPEGYVFWVSGNFRRAAIEPADFPHVNFTGYVAESAFYRRLADAQVVVDLTTHENCLVCGAYEAMALEKPLVTSATTALRHYFTAGAVFVEHRPAAIADGIRRAYEAREQLRAGIRDWRTRAARDNASKIAAIAARLNASGGEPQHGRA